MSRISGVALKPLYTVTAILIGFCGPFYVRAADHVPIPDFLQDRTNRGEDDIYDKFPEVTGIYAHGVAGDQLFPAETPLENFCEGTDKDRLEIVNEFGSSYEKEFWFFGTKSQGVLFINSLSISSINKEPSKFSNFIRPYLEVQRGYVADNFIHNFVFGANSEPSIGSYRQGRTTGEYSGGFLQPQTLMARSPLPRTRGRFRTSRATVADQPAVCHGMSDLVWHSNCYATRGSLRGMLLRSQAGDDEKILFNYEVTDIRVDARLPGLVFEVDRDWSLRD